MDQYICLVESILTFIITGLDQCGDQKKLWVKNTLRLLKIVRAGLFLIPLIAKLIAQVREPTLRFQWIESFIICLLAILFAWIFAKCSIKGVKRMRKGNSYKIAFSYAESLEGKTEKICKAIISNRNESLTREDILIKEWHKNEYNGTNVARNVQQILSDVELAVVILADDYMSNPWKKGEWKAIQKRIENGEAEKVLLYTQGDIDLSALDGLNANESRADDIDDMSDKDVAKQIIKKYKKLHEDNQQREIKNQKNRTIGGLVAVSIVVVVLVLFMLDPLKIVSSTETTEMMQASTVTASTESLMGEHFSLKSYEDVHKVLKRFLEEKIPEWIDDESYDKLKSFINSVIKPNVTVILETVKMKEPEELYTEKGLRYKWEVNTSQRQTQTQTDAPSIIVVFYDEWCKEVYIGQEKADERFGEGIVLYFGEKDKRERAYSKFGPPPSHDKESKTVETLIYYKNGNRFQGQATRNELTIKQGEMYLVNGVIEPEREMITGLYEGYFSGEYGHERFDDERGEFRVKESNSNHAKGEYYIGKFEEGVITKGRWFDEKGNMISPYPPTEDP